jgi:hypothetical protein
VHGLKANRGFIKLAQSRPKVKFFNRKVKEKNREYSSSYRERAAGRAKARGQNGFVLSAGKNLLTNK